METTEVRDKHAPRRGLRVLALAGLLATILLAVLMAAPTSRLVPSGILAYEFAATPERAGEILDGWGEAGRDAAVLSLWLDFAFLVAYVALYAGLALLAGRPGSRLARAAAVAAVLAGVCDLVENVALLVLLGAHGGPIPAAAPAVAAGMAAVKFTLLAAVTVYILVAAVHRLVARRSRGVPSIA